MRCIGLLAVLLALTSCRSAAPGSIESHAASAPPLVSLAFFPESAAAGARIVTLPESGVAVPVGPTPLVSSSDVLAVDVVQAELGPCLLFQLTEQAAQEVSRLAATRQRVVLIVDERGYAARRIDQPLDDGRLYIFPELPEPALSRFAGQLRAALPVRSRR